MILYNDNQINLRYDVITYIFDFIPLEEVSSNVCLVSKQFFTCSWKQRDIFKHTQLIRKIKKLCKPNNKKSMSYYKAKYENCHKFTKDELIDELKTYEKIYESDFNIDNQNLDQLLLFYLVTVDTNIGCRYTFTADLSPTKTHNDLNVFNYTLPNSYFNFYNSIKVIGEHEKILYDGYNVKNCFSSRYSLFQERLIEVYSKADNLTLEFDIQCYTSAEEKRMRNVNMYDPYTDLLYYDNHILSLKDAQASLLFNFLEKEEKFE